MVALADAPTSRLNTSSNNLDEPTSCIHQVKFKDTSDWGIGDSIIKAFCYGKSPWHFAGKVKHDYVPGQHLMLTRKRAVESGARNCFGNFSVLSTLGWTFCVRISHSSHRLKYEEDTTHVGSVTRVEIPIDCILIFHGLLYHYGGRDKWNVDVFETNLRGFTYLRDKDWKANSFPKRFMCKEEYYCSGCSKCLKIKGMLKK